MISHKYDYKYVNILKNDIYDIVNDSITINTKLIDDKKLGVMLVGIGGNNGSTFLSSILAYQKGIKWENKNGIHNIDFFGSLYQYGTCNIGFKDNKPYTKHFLK